jgi:hypothetical protein
MILLYKFTNRSQSKEKQSLRNKTGIEFSYSLVSTTRYSFTRYAGAPSRREPKTSLAANPANIVKITTVNRLFNRLLKTLPYEYSENLLTRFCRQNSCCFL